MRGWLDDDPRLRIGLTGGIGSGKSTVAAAFARRGVPAIDADVVARELTAPGSPALDAIAARFGADLIDPQGRLDRRALRARVFSDVDARAALEALLHPPILARMADLARASTGDYLLFIVPLLVERDLARLFDRVLVVDSTPEQQAARVVARDGETPAGVRLLLDAQADRAARLALADDLIQNSAGLDALDAAVGRLHENYVTLARHAPFPRSGRGGQNSAAMSVAPIQATELTALRTVAYEQPLNERMRTFMRLEFLFEQLAHHTSGTHLWDARAALTTLLEVLAILNKGDVRTEVLKELERDAVLLTRLRSRDGVDQQRAANILDSVDRIRKRVDTPERQLAQALRESEFLGNIRNRASIPGGTCAFDLPALHFWLSQTSAERARDLAVWLDHLDPVRRAIKLILMLTRESAVPARHEAPGGMFQMNLDGGLPHQLVRVLLAPELRVFPEISAGKHRFTIRFLERGTLDERAHQTQRDISFQLVLCQF